MKFTKFLAIALSLLMVFGMLASCGKTENPPVTTDPAGTSDSQATEKTDAPRNQARHPEVGVLGACGRETLSDLCRNGKHLYGSQ